MTAFVPLHRHWYNKEGADPLPLKTIKPLNNKRKWQDLPAIFQPSLMYSDHNSPDPFNFSEHIKNLCMDIAVNCSSFHHIDAQRIIFGVSQARSQELHGLQAKIIPMRFQDGKLRKRYRKTVYQVQRYWVNGTEIRYVINFCLPRFLDQSFENKMITIFHELYHIAPAFDGDLRRHEGRYCLHTHSQKHYDAYMATLVRQYLDTNPEPATYSFLRSNFEQLQNMHGEVLGIVVPAPKLLPVQAARKTKKSP